MLQLRYNKSLALSINSMAEEQEDQSQIIEIISWDIPEYEKHDRSKLWYLLFALIGLGILAYAVTTANFLFAIIVIIAGFVLIMNDARHPQNVSIALTTEGIFVGRKFYDYDEIKDFSIVYKPAENVKRLYFEFKSKTRHRLSIQLADVNPLFVRDNLLSYLTENIERTDETASETLAKVLKL